MNWKRVPKYTSIYDAINLASKLEKNYSGNGRER
jgi:hypothetical protein